MAGEVCFGNINGGNIRSELFLSFLELFLHDRQDKQHIGGLAIQNCGALLHMGRNDVVKSFLEGSQDWLFFVDSDMKLEPDTLDRLMEVADSKKRPIVGATCVLPTRGGDVVPLYYMRKPSSGESRRPIPRYSPKTQPADKLVRVDATGTGCLLIHRRVFEEMAEAYSSNGVAMPTPWFDFENFDGVAYGEDLTFCHRARALGIPIYVHTGIAVGHVKSMLLTVGAAE